MQKKKSDFSNETSNGATLRKRASILLACSLAGAADAKAQTKTDGTNPEVAKQRRATPDSPVVRVSFDDPPATTISFDDLASGVHPGSGPLFPVRSVAFDRVYLNLDHDSTLQRGTVLEIRRQKALPSMAEVRVASIGANIAICEVVSARQPIKPGDFASLTIEGLRAYLKQHGGVQAASAKSAPPSVPTSGPLASVLNLFSATGTGASLPAASAEAERAVSGPESVVSSTAILVPHRVAQPQIANSVLARVAAGTTPSLPLIASSPVLITGPEHSSRSTTALAVPSVSAPVAEQVSTSAAVKRHRPESSAPSMTHALVETAQVTPAPSTTQAVLAQQSLPPAASSTTAAFNSQVPAVAVTEPAKEDAATATAAAATAPPTEDDSATLADIQRVFKIKFVSEDAVYLIGGTESGLRKGMKLTVKRSEIDVNQRGTLAKASQVPVLATLEVISVARTSAVCTVVKKQSDLQPDDIALLERQDAETIAEKKALIATSKYPQVISFSDGDPLEEEVRESVPKPPLPEVNRMRGRIGFDYGGIHSGGAFASTSNQMGAVLRADMTRIGGTYWSLSGYWRGRMTHYSYTGQETLQDLLNRTYHLNLTFDSPTSRWVAGFGRLYLPWASSLDTLDGGYFGRKFGSHVTAGIFAGSTPDPTSWNYNPDRQIGGAFVNYEAGSYDHTRFTTTVGLGVSALKWRINDPLLFTETGLSFKRYFSVYDAMQADAPRPTPGFTPAGKGLSRNFLTVRFQPHKRLSFDVNENYFRDIPTFNTALLATGLLDKYIFQGLSFGARAETIKTVTVYGSFGKSNRSGDTSSSWNQMYGLSVGNVLKTGLRADVHTSKFNSSFGSGKYTSFSLSRNVRDTFRLELQGGQQSISSQLSAQNTSHFVNLNVDGNLGHNYFIQGAYTINRGGPFSYNQWTTTFGYRFDNRGKGKVQ